MKTARRRRPKPRARRRRTPTQLERVQDLNRRGEVAVHEYYALGEDEGPYRLELIDGTIVVSPSARRRHQDVVQSLSYVLLEQLFFTGKGTVHEDLDVELDEGNAPRPDLAFVSKRRGAIVEDRIYGVPDFVIEVLSPSTRTLDSVTKRERYAKAGVPYYWIVDADRNRVDFFRLARGEYRLARSASAPALARPPGFRDLRLPLDMIFGP